MEWLESLRQLRDILAKLYYKKEKAERVTEDALKEFAINIDFTGDVRSMWRNIMVYAHNRNEVELIVRIAQKEFESNKDCVEELDKHLRNYYFEKVSGVKAKEFIEQDKDESQDSGPRSKETLEQLIQLSKIQSNIVSWKDIHNHLDELHSAIREFRMHIESISNNDLGEYREILRRFGAVEEEIRNVEAWVINTHLPYGKEIFVRVDELHKVLKNLVDEFENLKPTGRFARTEEKEKITNNINVLWNAANRYVGEVLAQMTQVDKRLLTEARKLSASIGMRFDHDKSI